MCGGDFPHALVIAIWRDQNAASAHDGFGNEGADILLANILDGVQHIVGQHI